MKKISSLILFYCLQFKTSYLASTCVFVCPPQEEVKRLRVHIEEVIKENGRLHDEIAKIGGVSQKDW